MNTCCFRIPFILAILLMTCSLGFAQKSTGDVLGIITDPNGAALANVSVTLTNIQTNDKRQSNTDTSGNYRFSLVDPGTYTVKAELTGFSGSQIDNLEVRVDTPRRQDIVLQVGAVTENVRVEANAVAVNSETPSIGTVIEERLILELPLNGRSFLSLTYLAPGTVNPSVGNIESNATSLSGGRPSVAVSVAGLREGSNDILFDGVPSKHNFYGAVGTLPPPESIAEFKVQQGYFSPEYGLPAVINVVTKSGTNEIHGALWEFLRNDKLDARNAFALGKGPNRQNQYGFAVGGPVLKNKLFFFGTYEGQPIRRSFTGGRAIVPTQAMLNGDFSALLPNQIIYDPLTYNPTTKTRQPFPGNIIPQGRITNFAKNYSSLFIPQPTTLTSGAFNYISTTRFKQDDKNYSFRIDWNLSDRNKVFGRYSDYNSAQFTSGVLPFSDTETPYKTKNLAIGWTHVINSNLVNEARAGLDRAFLNSAQPANTTSNEDFPTKLGLKNLNTNPACNGATSISLAGYASFGFAFQNCIITGNNNIRLIDNLAYNRGSHNISVGGQYTRIRLHDIFGFTQTGSLSYTGQFSGNSVADFLLGAPFTATGGTTSDQFRYGLDWDAYFNDNFKVTRNLTLNFGLRYQYVSPFTEKHDIQGSFDFSTGRIRVAGKDGFPRTVISKDKDDFAPRVGLAWAPGGSDKWALRASYGIFYDRIPGNELVWAGLFPPIVSGQSFVSDQNIPTIDVANLFPSFTSTDPNQITGGPFLFNLSDRRSPYIQQWTGSVQHTLPWGILAEVGYIGSKGTHLSKRFDSNVAPLPALNDTRPLQQRRPYPKFSFILDDKGVATSSYHGLLTSLRKSYANGLVFQSSYTWSKSLDEDSFDAKATRNYFLADQNKGRSVHDIRHRFVYSMSYEIPFGDNLEGIARQVVRGWEINSIVTLQSGAPFSVNTIADPSDTGAIFNHYPNRICDGNLPSGQRNRDHWFDTKCFVLPAFRTYGNAGVNYLSAPGYKDVDLSLAKSFSFSETMRLQLRAEAFNIFNYTNLGRPNATLESPTFGKIFSAGAARTIQLGIKFYF